MWGRTVSKATRTPVEDHEEVADDQLHRDHAPKLGVVFRGCSRGRSGPGKRSGRACDGKVGRA